MTPSLLALCWAGIFLANQVVAVNAQERGHDPSDALFDPSRVIQIEIWLDPKDWHALRISHPFLDADGGIFSTEKGYQYCKGQIVIDGKAIEQVGVRKKGSWGSIDAGKPSLKVRFNEYQGDQRFGELDMLTLNNCPSDPTHAREFLVYSFMSRAGVPAPRNNLATAFEEENRS